MTIDLHIHSNASDGKLTTEELITEAKNRKIGFMSITDHDNISCQSVAIVAAKKAGIEYITGVELNVTFSNPKYKEGKPFSLDFLGYQFDHQNKALQDKLLLMAKYREERAAKILDQPQHRIPQRKHPRINSRGLTQNPRKRRRQFRQTPYRRLPRQKRHREGSARSIQQIFGQMRRAQVPIAFGGSLKTRPRCRRKTCVSSSHGPVRHLTATHNYGAL